MIFFFSLKGAAKRIQDWKILRLTFAHILVKSHTPANIPDAAKHSATHLIVRNIKIERTVMRYVMSCLIAFFKEGMVRVVLLLNVFMLFKKKTNL